MVCRQCGLEQQAGAQFCSKCGAGLQAAAPPPQAAWAQGYGPGYVQGMMLEQRIRVRQNLQPLGIMWCIFGVYRLAALLIAGAVLHTIAENGAFWGMPANAAHMMHALYPVIGFVTVVMAGAAMLTGYGLLTQKPWARVLAIVFGILALLKLPFGTALGIYTLWVLAPQASGVEWDAMTRGNAR